jgi:hypothetical protein
MRYIQGTVSMRIPLLVLALLPGTANAALSNLEVNRNEPVLSGKSFGLAGSYRKLSGKAHFTLDPNAPSSQAIVDLKLAPKNSAGLVEFDADFYLLTPSDPAKSNGKLLYEVGNRGTKAALRVFQKAEASPDPTTAQHFGDGFLMEQGYSILWMGWQWDVPEGRMRMNLPIATENGTPIQGLVRGNFILYKRSPTAELADRNHLAYEPASMDNPEDFMTIRDTATGAPQRIPRADWQMLPAGKVSLKGGFAPGMIYDVVYKAKNPRVLGASLAATRDLIAYFKTAANKDLPAIKLAYGWGVSQSGRYLRHFLYEGFNEQESGGKVFDAVLDEVGGAGRGSFNNRFGQASRDAEQHFNFFFPVDIFPFTDGPSTDPFTKQADSLLARAEAKKLTPLIFHVLSSSEYYNRAGSLIHTDPQGKTDIAPPTTSRIYLVSSTPHFPGTFPPSNQGETAAPLSPLSRTPIMRALFTALDAWACLGINPPDSQYPKLANQTLVAPTSANWPSIPNVILPPPALKVYQLDFATEPPKIGPQYTTLVPALDANGHDIAGIHHPAISVPLATYTGWNYRHPNTGAPSQLAGETGSILPFAKTKAARNVVTDSRPSIAERYPSKEHYLGQYAAAAQTLIRNRFLLAIDLPDMLDQATLYYDTFTRP